MKIQHPILATLLVATLTSCYVTPRPARNPYSPHSPGGRIITPMERNDHSPLSPGGRYITPAERRSHILRGTR
ncbi:MAG: hypothetical protein ACKVY0_24830 [Prosthecobacter sp.]|uniref:hypothetical protein n=1 Tax=Prosthecobacter sp. TaxID=1965333 RepID=UPI0038FD5248